MEMQKTQLPRGSVSVAAGLALQHTYLPVHYLKFSGADTMFIPQIGGLFFPPVIKPCLFFATHLRICRKNRENILL